MSTNFKPKLLTYLGAIPFAYALAVAAYGHFNLGSIFGYEMAYPRFRSYLIAHTYGAVIVAFLGGIQWGITVQQPHQKPYYLVSNVLALAAWLSLFAFASFTGVAVLFLALILALLVDRHAHNAGLLPAWFWQLRVRISVLVISMLLLLLVINQ